MNRVIIDADGGAARINKNIYGHFAEHLGRCVYEGLWVGEDSPIPHTRGIRDDVVAALRRVRVPVLRWPGGCFADEYHWRDGVGPREKRPAMVNTHWGGVAETNAFGTHEFLDFCAQAGAAPYICGNVGSGTVRELQEWVEYITHDGPSAMAGLRRANGQEEPWKLPYVGVGNESWGCGGHMRPEYYADLYRRYATYVRDFSGNRVFKIACGADRDDYAWTDALMREAGRYMDGLSLHYYTVPGPDWGHKGSATAFDEGEWFAALRACLFMDELIAKHGAIMDHHDPARRVALVVDEWGAWYDVEPGTNPGFLYQQNTLRDALVAGLTLNIFNRHAGRVRMANLAQTVNVLQALILTDGPAMVTTPTYHVFDLYKAHQGALALRCDVESEPYTLGKESIPGVNASASRNDAGRLSVTLCNTDPHEAADVSCAVRGLSLSHVEGTALTADAMNAHNTFEQPDKVTLAAFDGARVTPDGLDIALPPRSVVLLSAT